MSEMAPPVSSIPSMTTTDDMREAAVLQREELLDAEDQAARAATGEGLRSQVYLNINGEMVPVVDQPDSVKHAVSQEAVTRRAQDYEAETYRLAKYKLSKMNEVEAIDHIAELSGGDKEIFLKAEAEGKKRAAIFEVFGHPEGDE